MGSRICSASSCATTPALAAGTPLSFEVKPIPLEGRPASFSGAVGSGFSIDVSANRSVVRVGDPISLTLSVPRRWQSGTACPCPHWRRTPGLSADLFQIPTEQVAGTFDGNAKQFKVNVRVKDQRVTQIPPIEFSWFDPVKEQFQTTQSKPIALQVMEAQVVSAADVVAATPAQDPASRPAGTPSASGDARGRCGCRVGFRRCESGYRTGRGAAVDGDSPRNVAQLDRHGTLRARCGCCCGRAGRASACADGYGGGAKKEATQSVTPASRRRPPPSVA